MTDSPPASQDNWRADLRKRWEANIEQARRDNAEHTRKRREGRPHGELSESLIQRLRNCNPPQLQNVIRSCRELLKAHRRPPLKSDCRNRFQGSVRVSVAVGNKRYQYETRSCGKDCGKCPNHGPYLYVYMRDGALFPAKSLGRAPFKAPVPRKVKTAIHAFHKEERNLQPATGQADLS